MKHKNPNAKAEKPLDPKVQIEQILGSTDPEAQLQRLQALMRLAAIPAAAGVLVTVPARNLNYPAAVIPFPAEMSLGNALTVLRNAERIVLTEIARQEAASNHTHPETPPDPEKEKSS